MTGAPEPLILVAEVAAALAEAGALRCIPDVALTEHADHDTLTITLVLPLAVDDDGLHALARATDLFHRLRRLHDLGLLRSLAARYDIPAEQLEALLPKETLE